MNTFNYSRKSCAGFLEQSIGARNRAGIGCRTGPPGPPVKGQGTRFSTSGFFHESVSPKQLSIPLIRGAAQGAPPVSLTPVVNGKNLQS